MLNCLVDVAILTGIRTGDKMHISILSEALFAMGFLRKYIYPTLFGILLFPLMKFFFPKLKVFNSAETIEHLKANNKLSIVRFGDGEFDVIMGGKGPGYQQKSKDLQKKLRQVLEKKEVLVAIPAHFSMRELNREKMSKGEFLFWRSYMTRKLLSLRKLLRTDRLYGDACVSRPYTRNFDKAYASSVFNEIRNLWDQQDVVLIEGSQTRFGLGNDLLNNAKSVRRIIGPAKNAFDKYYEILCEAKKQPKGTVFIVALGPAAKLLVADLCADYRVLDLGHLDIEYEWFLRNVKTRVSIPNKYVNETKNRFVEDVNVFDNVTYESQIIARIE